MQSSEIGQASPYMSYGGGAGETLAESGVRSEWQG